MELWDILDVEGNLTGKLVERGKPMLQNEFHLVVHIWIRNSAGKFLIAKRAENKPSGGMWETTGGSAIAGESSLETAIRETNEELGLVLEPEKCKQIVRKKRIRNDYNDFVDAWLCFCDKQISELKPDRLEVSDVRWAEKYEIREMIGRKEFLDVFPYLEQLFIQSFPTP